MRTAAHTFVFLTLTLQASMACECIAELTETLKQKVAKSGVVFYGEVVPIKDGTVLRKDMGSYSPNLSSQSYTPQFRLIDLLKGDLDVESNGDTFFNLAGPSICSPLFKTGERYLVFAFLDENGKIQAFDCPHPLVFEDQKAYRAKRREIKKALRHKVS